MNEVVAAGEKILRGEATRIRAEAEAMAMAELRTTAPAILDLLAAISTRLASVEAELAATRRDVQATRIRRPHRDINGQIDYVVDSVIEPGSG